MKIFVCASKHCYDRVLPIGEELERLGHTITLPNSFDDPQRENRLKEGVSQSEYRDWKARMFREQEEKVQNNDAILVLNFEKHGTQNYIGGAVFLEMFKAWELGKKIYLYNPVPEGMLYDEIVGMNPIVLKSDLRQVR